MTLIYPLLIKRLTFTYQKFRKWWVYCTNQGEQGQNRWLERTKRVIWLFQILKHKPRDTFIKKRVHFFDRKSHKKSLLKLNMFTIQTFFECLQCLQYIRKWCRCNKTYQLSHWGIPQIFKQPFWFWVVFRSMWPKKTEKMFYGN